MLIIALILIVLSAVSSAVSRFLRSPLTARDARLSAVDADLDA